jgi:polyisoprenoid-binding protein YceI
MRKAIVPMIVTSIALTAGLAAFVALHPGVGFAEPRIAVGEATPFAPPASYTIDPMHGNIAFEITHLGLSEVHGRFNKFSGKIREDAQEIGKSSVEFTAQADSLDTALAMRDEHLRGPEYFDTARYPELTFKSTTVARAGDGYVVTGDLTIKGQTKSIVLPFKHYGPLSLKGVGDDSTRVGIIAEPITIKRSDFGVGKDIRLPDGTEGASDAVTVRISLEATLDQ